MSISQFVRINKEKEELLRCPYCLSHDLSVASSDSWHKGAEDDFMLHTRCENGVVTSHMTEYHMPQLPEGATITFRCNNCDHAAVLSIFEHLDHCQIVFAALKQDLSYDPDEVEEDE